MNDEPLPPTLSADNGMEEDAWAEGDDEVELLEAKL
jgi:hypothetical protein